MSNAAHTFLVSFAVSEEIPPLEAAAALEATITAVFKIPVEVRWAGGAALTAERIAAAPGEAEALIAMARDSRAR